MHYSALNAVNAASPASASPSSSSLSPIGSSLVGNHSHQQSHSHYHHLSSSDGTSNMSHHSELMASLSDNGLSPVSGQSSYNGVPSNHSVVSKSESMCDNLATPTATYTTLQSVGSSASAVNTHNGHYAAQQSTANQSMAQSGNSSSSTPAPSQAKGIKRSAPSTTATKSTYSNGSKANGTTAANGSSAAGSGGTSAANSGRTSTSGGKKTKGRVKIKMEFIDNKLRRYTTFSKRKTGIMKKAYELSTLTGTQVMLLVASETGHVYTFATRKLQPMITSDAGKALIQTCLNSPDPSGLITGTGVANDASSGNGGNTGPDVVTTNGHVSSLVSSGNNNGSNSVGGQHMNSSEQHHNSDLSRMMAGQQQGGGGSGGGNGGPTGSLSGCSTPNTVIDQRMSATGFEETELSYSVNGDDCSPLNDKNLFNSLNLGNSVNLVNNSFASTSNGHLLRQKGSSVPQTNFFINETPELGQCSEDDEDDEEEEDEDEEMDEGEDEIDLDPDMAYLAGLQSMDTDLTRFIGSAVGGTATSTPMLLNDAMLGSAMWQNSVSQHTMAKPATTVSSGQLQQQQHLQQPQQQCTGNSAGYVSDRTKMNLNLKLQQKQQMQQRSQQSTSSMRSSSQQRPSQAFNANFQGPKQTTTGKATNLPKSSTTTSLVKNVNSKRLTSSSKSASGKSGSSATGTSNLNSNSSLVLNASSGISSMNSSNSSFVNFDPASFLDSCFNTSNASPESTSLLDGHSSLDQMLLNNSELLLLNQPNAALSQPMTTEQLMMMIGSQTPVSHGQYSAPTNKAVSTGHNSGGSGKSTSRNNNNRSHGSSQIFGGIRTPTSLMNHINSSSSTYSFSSSSSKLLNAGSQSSGSNFSSAHAGNNSGQCVVNASSKQQLLVSSTSSSASLCPMTTSTVSTFSNPKQTQSVAQSKAANLNAIINNLASANNGAVSGGAGTGSHNSGGILDGNSSSLQQSTVGHCPPNRMTGNSGTLPENSSATNITGPNNASASAAGQHQQMQPNGNNFSATAVAAAQQLLSGSAGNIILCTTTPTSSTIAFPPSATSQLDQRHSVTSLANSTVSTSTGSAQIFSFPPGHSTEGPPTALLLPANLHTASGQLSIQQPVVASGAGSGGQRAQQLIYNAFSRFIYPSSTTNANQGQLNCNRSVEAHSSAPLGSNSANDSTQTISTLISHDGQLYQLNMANNSANPIAQIVTPNLPLECSSSSRLRIKAECHSDGNTTNSSISLVQPNTTLLHSDLHSISLDSLLGSSLGPTPAPLITTFQPTITPISVNNSNSFGSTKSQPGSKKQRSK